jgi:hypothetical protein
MPHRAGHWHFGPSLVQTDWKWYAGGCEANYLPEIGVSDNWFPDRDNYVPAPKGYRQTEGRCTRCGNIYEPACKGKDGSPLCFIDKHAGVKMETSKVHV